MTNTQTTGFLYYFFFVKGWNGCDVVIWTARIVVRVVCVYPRPTVRRAHLSVRGVEPCTQGGASPECLCGDEEAGSQRPATSEGMDRLGSGGEDAIHLPSSSGWGGCWEGVD